MSSSAGRPTGASFFFVQFLFSLFVERAAEALDSINSSPARPTEGVEFYAAAAVCHHLAFPFMHLPACGNGPPRALRMLLCMTTAASSSTHPFSQVLAPLPLHPCSKWGSLRAAMGHPEPWNLTWMAIGNEVGASHNSHGRVCCCCSDVEPHLDGHRQRGGFARLQNVAVCTSFSIAVVFCCELRDLAPKNMLLIKYMLFLAATSPQDCGKPFYLNNYLAFFGAIRAKYPHMVRGPARLLLMCVVNSNSFAYLNSRCDFCLEPSAPSTRTW